MSSNKGGEVRELCACEREAKGWPCFPVLEVRTGDQRAGGRGCFFWDGMEFCDGMGLAGRWEGVFEGHCKSSRAVRSLLRPRTGVGAIRDGARCSETHRPENRVLWGRPSASTLSGGFFSEEPGSRRGAGGPLADVAGGYNARDRLDFRRGTGTLPATINRIQVTIHRRLFFLSFSC